MGFKSIEIILMAPLFLNELKKYSDHNTGLKGASKVLMQNDNAGDLWKKSTLVHAP